MSTSRKTLAAVTVGAVTLASAAYAVGSTAGGGSAFALGGGGGQTANANDPWLENLASKMGVEPSKLADALTAVRKEQEPKGDLKDDLAKVLATELGVSQDKVEDALKDLRPGRGDGPHLSVHVGIPDEVADALAKELGVSADKVKAAFEKFAPKPPDPGSGSNEPPKPVRPDLGDIAKGLGVSEEKLKDALEKVRPKVGRGDRKFRVHPGGRGGFARPGGPDGPGGPGRAFGGDDIAADLAKKLGVSEAKVKAALEKVREAAVQRAQERHDAFVKALADKLGISVEKVQQALGSVPGRGGFGFGGHPRP